MTAVETHQIVDGPRRITTCLAFGTALVRGQWWWAKCSCGIEVFVSKKSEVEQAMAEEHEVAAP